MVQLITRGKFHLTPEKVMRYAKSKADAGVARVAMRVTNDIKKLISKGGGKGRSKGRGVHSLPGEPPRLQTGNLRSSTQRQKVGDAKWVVGFTRYGFYWRHLEFGAPKINLLPRPFVMVAYNIAKQKWAEDFAAIKDTKISVMSGYGSI